MTLLLVAVCIALLCGLWWLVAAERRLARNHLLARGERTVAVAEFQRRDPRRPGIIVASFPDNRGHRRTVAKTPVRAADRTRPISHAVIIFDPRWPGRDDLMLLGFGEHPTRWHRVEFHERSVRRAWTHV